MFSFLRKILPSPRAGRAASASVPRPRTRLGVEALDDRALPSAGLPDIAILSARLEDPTAVAFEYRKIGHTSPFRVGVYRSADPAFDPADERVGGTIVRFPGGGVRTGRVDLGAELPTDPARKYVLVVADPGGTVAERDEGNNAASFRKLALSGIAHGFTLTGQVPAWMEPMAQALEAKGYDAVIRYEWLALSQNPVPGGAVIAGQDLAARVRAAAAALAVRPGDVVDLHLIGHSRGTGVVSQALLGLDQVPGPRALQLGYTTQTLLDPHVARNEGTLAEGLTELATGTGVSRVGGFSYDPTNPTGVALATGTLTFQALAQDPPAFVPAGVDRTEVFFQRLAWYQTAPGSVELLIGLNFLSPLPGDIPNPFGWPVYSIDVGAYGVGHFEVPQWYLANVVLPPG
ncbi:MAG TPA: hypothetical protein VM597_20000 [Gemmataceae bacterium]|nr:hypothetical protein [Gemmataceae bacterium]